MRALFLPRGWNDELRAALVERGRCWGYLHLFRASPFTRAEVAALTTLVGDLAFALRVATLQTVDLAVEIPLAVLVVGRAGHVLARTRAAAHAVSALPRDPAHEGASHGIVDVAERALASGGAAESHVSTPSGLVRLVATAEDACAVVVVERARSRDVTKLAFAAHRLSRREEEVCLAMLRGLSDDEIATALGVRTHTVKSHAKAVFAKLQVAGRGGLLAKVDRAG
jgi:DNA-binding CsgD family transcriptional regulator